MNLGDLDDVSNTSHDIILRTSLLLFTLHLKDASAPLVLRDTCATDPASLFLSHARVDIDILDLDIQWAVSWPNEPAVALPAEIQEHEQRTSEIELEELVGVQVRAADRVQRDVELTHESENVDEQAQV